MIDLILGGPSLGGPSSNNSLFEEGSMIVRGPLGHFLAYFFLSSFPFLFKLLLKSFFNRFGVPFWKGRGAFRIVKTNTKMTFLVLSSSCFLMPLGACLGPIFGLSWAYVGTFWAQKVLTILDFAKFVLPIIDLWSFLSTYSLQTVPKTPQDLTRLQF